MSHNLIPTLEDLIKIPNKENFVVLCIESNPCARNPNLIPLSLKVLPRLVEVDGFKITDNTRQDISDSACLSSLLIKYVCKNDRILEGLTNDVNKIKLEFEILQTCRHKFNSETGPFLKKLMRDMLVSLKK